VPRAAPPPSHPAVLDTKWIWRTDDAVEIAEPRGLVEFDDVDSVPGAKTGPVRISFTPNRTDHAIVGSTGSGRPRWPTDPRFYDVTSGSVRLDASCPKLRTETVAAHRRGASEAFLFSGTVASNLRYGDETADDEPLARLEIARERFVTAMEGGWKRR